ncbi:putative NRPS-like protein biosynthetic cluster [Amphichorda felina]
MASHIPQALTTLHDRYGNPKSLDHVIRLRAQDAVQVPLMAYADNPQAPGEYHLLTGQQLDRLIDAACWALVDAGIRPNQRDIVALYGESGLSYAVTLLALMRLGCQVMTVSIRLGAQACQSLLERAGCKSIMYGTVPRVTSVVSELSSSELGFTLRPILSWSDLDRLDSPVAPFERPPEDVEPDCGRAAIIMHSSGSTGHPKLLLKSNRSLLEDLLAGKNCRCLNPHPWFHMYGLVSAMQVIYRANTAYLWNGLTPMTTDSLVEAAVAFKPELFMAVPYVLQLMAETPQGLDVLRQCRHVLSGGARTPDELGDMLVREGVPISVTYGLTECGNVGHSMYRPAGDDSWNYMHVHERLRPHVFFDRIQGAGSQGATDTYEAVYLRSYPGLIASNSDDPEPDSYRSGDMFVPHASTPHAWKYVARADDCITLANGEKINPVAMEGALRQHPLIHDALMFGIDRPLPGFLVFQADRVGAEGLSDGEYMEAIGPALHEANALADEFARVVVPDMVVLVPPGVEYPTTDKKNVIRGATYHMFEERIQAAYSEFESAGGQGRGDEDETSNVQGEKLRLDVPKMERYLLDQFQNLVCVTLSDVEADFFSAGVDSLAAIQVRRTLQRDLDLGGASLPPNIVYDSRNVSRLARWLHGLRTGEDGLVGTSVEEDAVKVMEGLMDKYSHFEPFRPQNRWTPSSRDVVLLTGATGALGAHILHHLVQRSNVSHVYCIARGGSPDTVRQRVLDSLEQRGIDTEKMGQDMLGKFSVLHSTNLDAQHLGLPSGIYDHLKDQTTLIIHAAWPVNFRIPLVTFEPHISGLHNLLQLALSVPRPSPARLLFASSVSTALAAPKHADGSPAVIPEAPIPLLSHCLETGYAQSKLVGERICERAAAAAAAGDNSDKSWVGVLRIGQIAGDTARGLWNPKEAIPLMVHSAMVVGCLPLLDGEQGVCEWMPVDAMAEACLQVGDVLQSQPRLGDGWSASYYNLVAPHSYLWNDDILPALREAGLSFEAVPFATWLSKLQAYEGDMDKLPALKLLDHYQSMYGDSAGTGLTFDLSRGCRDLPALRKCPRIVERGLVGLFVKGWINAYM